MWDLGVMPADVQQSYQKFSKKPFKDISLTESSLLKKQKWK